MNLRRNQPATRRRGVILLVVLAMLTLFAIAGITFVLYANAASESARISRDAESYSTSFPDMDPSTSLNFFLAELIYGVDDNSSQFVESALRGHSLAETMYGSWDSLGTVPSDVAFSGTGRLHETVVGTDGFNLVNYTFFPSDNFLRDPSRLSTRANLGAARGTYTGGQNPPYTYPDLNNMFLASINSSTGQVVMPSYYRPWNFNTPGHTNFNDQSNPNWVSATGKYLTLRPRPQEYGVPLPLPTDPNGTTGDVKNLPGSTTNDSIWIDIGAPVLSTASGLRYKMLVAPLIIDLDRCINLNVAGNIMRAGNAHASNQGWGPWEVNPSKVLNAAGGPNEWQNLFVGNAARSRYGAVGTPPSNGLPNSLFALQGPTPHVYAPGDLNGLNDPGQPGAGTPTGLYNLPGSGGYAPTASFPNFPTSGYGNNANGFLEVTVSGSGPPYNHAMFFNPFTAPSGNNLFSIQNNASLLWAGAAASPNSDFRQLCPTQFNPTDATTLKRILQTTPLSMDMDRGGASPYVFDPNGGTHYAISYTPASGATAGAYSYASPPTVSFPNLPIPAPPAGSEFDAGTWRSALPRLLTRLDLNRALTPYTGATGNPVQADADRTKFATDIFNQLVRVTGAVPAPAPAATPDYNTSRWLAQLAVNIVDYIDTDDVITAFNWDTANSTSQGAWVYGTELPKLVVNEVYFQYDNDTADLPPNPPPAGNKASKPFQVRVWAELLNPMPSDTNASGNPSDLNGSNQAVLQNGTTALYQLVLTQPNTHLRDPGNTAGDPDSSTQAYTPPATPPGQWGGPQVLGIVNDWSSTPGDPTTVLPVGTNYTGSQTAPNNNQGFFVVGPKAPAGYTLAAPVQGMPTPSHLSPGLVYTVPTTDGTADDPHPPTLLLQRLANPNKPFAAMSNPYVTVDYVDLTNLKNGAPPTYSEMNDARTYTTTMKVTTPPMQPYTNFHSYGRTQPFAADYHQWMQQKASGGSGPQTTFFQHNAVEAPPGPPSNSTAGQTLKVPFDWLVHLDRPLISPIELLNVSGFKPSELTQQFVTGTTGFGTSFNHVAPWTDENARLYRLLEFVKVKNMMPGVVDGGRVPGKVNINTLDSNELEVFRALCDAQQGNSFYNSGAGTPDDNVNAVLTAIIAARTPGDPVNTIPAGTPSSKDRPFWGMAMGAYPPTDTQYPAPGGGANVGIANTLLAPITGGTSTSARLLTPSTLTGAHPYQQMELLNKLFNNVTTRSNTFAVWLTVGFFPITNDQVQPNQLGPEINLANGRNIRHHMFAIVDRTQIVTFGNLNSAAPSAIHYTGPGIFPPAGTTINASFTIATPINDPPTRTGHSWTPQAGSLLVFDPGTLNEETVVVQGAAPTFNANFTKNHNTGANIISRGHPGPMNINTYDVNNDQFVVPYAKIID